VYIKRLICLLSEGSGPTDVAWGRFLVEGPFVKSEVFTAMRFVWKQCFGGIQVPPPLGSYFTLKMEAAGFNKVAGL
jgi:hypothetical protein